MSVNVCLCVHVLLMTMDEEGTDGRDDIIAIVGTCKDRLVLIRLLRGLIAFKDNNKSYSWMPSQRGSMFSVC